MNARVIPIDPDRPDADAISGAAGCLRRGGLVILPTETVYGLCADPRQPAAMERLYAAKGRDEKKPVAWFINDLSMLWTLGVENHPSLGRLASAFWPGPLTLVLDAGGGAIGFRWPDHPAPLAVLAAFGNAFAATSANRSGHPDARTAAEAAAHLGGHADLILDAGPVRGGIPSTVVRLRPDGTWSLLRAGAIPESAIADTLRPA